MNEFKLSDSLIMLPPANTKLQDIKEFNQDLFTAVSNLFPIVKKFSLKKMAMSEKIFTCWKYLDQADKDIIIANFGENNLVYFLISIISMAYAVSDDYEKMINNPTYIEQKYLELERIMAEQELRKIKDGEIDNRENF